MYRLFILIIILGFGYFIYDTYGYRYVISNVVSEENGSMSTGAVDPDINIVAYIDYDSRASKRTYLTLLNLMSSDPNIRVLIRPVETDSKFSKLMTRIALSANNQEQFMNVTNVFLTNNINVDERYIENAIRSLGLNYNNVRDDATSTDIESKVSDLQSEAQLLNIQSFPFVFIDHVKMPSTAHTLGDFKAVIGDLRTGRR